MILITLLSGTVVFGQQAVPQTSAAPAASVPEGTTQKGVANPASKVTGVDEVPLLDPGSETIFWDGKTWSMGDQRGLQARWEKFLNEPEDEVETYRAYNDQLTEIINVLSASSNAQSSSEATARAFALLQQASQYRPDAGLCQTISNQVVAAWRGSKNGAALAAANRALENERKRVEWNKQVTLQANSLAQFGRNSSDGLAGENKKAKQFLESTGYDKRLTEIETQLKGNDLKGELVIAKRKLEFQALIVQLFFQRRFQHAIIGVRFYNSVYGDGDNELQLGEDTKNLFSRTAGMSPSLFTLESLARETMGDVQKGTDAAIFLIRHNEMASGARRLMESFLPGEYAPAIRTLERDTKREVLSYERNRLKLLAAVETKDYTLIGELLPEIAKTAKDFDDTKYRGLIETAKAQANFHIAKAQDAAVNGERANAQAELQAAGEIWPRNPALEEASKALLSISSGQGKALKELDDLLKQRNDRAIYDQKEKFISAVAFAPDRQEPTKAAIERIAKVEAVLAMAQEIARTGNAALAWEKLDKLHQKSKDAKVSEQLADLSAKASEYVSALRAAEAAATQQNIGSALALYLRAQALAPGAEVPVEQLAQLSKQALEK
ncbi:MAG: hypothetical protein IAE94_06065 [Chthoniobacterales bacterium]|nr:hypothetical protein [Chthoniobacterales bacterium]